jgi:hypothetical protein
MKRVTPVAFPPGWLRLDTSPMVTGSPPSVNTIGMAEVAAFAASAAMLPPVAAITITGRSTSAAASPGSRSYRPSVHPTVYQASGPG